MLKTISAFAAVAAATVLVAPTVSHAAGPNSVRVSYADLNLGSGDGQQALERRISFAARVICDMGETSRELDLAYATKVCREATIADAQPAFEAAVNAYRRGTVTVLDAAALIITAK